MYIGLEGAAELILPNRAIPLDPGTFVRVGPDTCRGIRTGPAGLRMLVVSGRPGLEYVPAPNSELGGPAEPGSPDAAGAMVPGTIQTLTARLRY